GQEIAETGAGRGGHWWNFYPGPAPLDSELAVVLERAGRRSEPDPDGKGLVPGHLRGAQQAQARYDPGQWRRSRLWRDVQNAGGVGTVPGIGQTAPAPAPRDPDASRRHGTGSIRAVGPSRHPF